MQRIAGMFVLAGMVMALALAAAPAGVSEAGAFPSIINLPNGQRPEGIAVGRGSSFYVGSLANGAVYRGDLRIGAGDVLVPGVAGRALTGLFVDERSNYLFASGAGSGRGFVFDADTGAELAMYQLAEGTPTFVNDVVVTREAAYFRGVNQGAAQPNLNTTIIKAINVALPPLAEQTRIVAEVERRLSVVEELESVVSASLQRAVRLRQSILQKAFTGELTETGG